MKNLLSALVGLFCILCLTPVVCAAPGDYFQITVVDAATGQGVPLVSLQTVNAVSFVTDSAGVIALQEPELMGRRVWFTVSSHGYECPADGFGYRGAALDVRAGGRAVVKVTRVNIAERLYRMTGAGIYRDSVLLGLPTPISQPLMNGGVLGQDTVMATPYRGKLYWFFGDTQRVGYPLGQFATSGATSQTPNNGGLAPGRGVDLTYWVDAEGFSRPLLPLPGFGGPVWVGGVFALSEAGGEHLYTHYTHLDNHGKAAEQGVAVFDDARAVFTPLKKFALDAPLVPDGQPFQARVGERRYLYCQARTLQAVPLVRVPADRAHITDPRAYEGFTCLPPGGRYAGSKTRLDRTPGGRLVYGWKPDAPPLGEDEQAALIAAKTLKPNEVLAPLRDIETDAPVHSHGGSVYWNPYRGRWVMISGQAGGTSSYLGEIWFAEADTPTGPWAYARKIVTHDHYTFYNPAQHPFFDEDGGRVIYFEGTYTDTYSGNAGLTPRYNYNQIMYRLTLDDPRLSLPVPVYQMRPKSGSPDYLLRGAVDARQDWKRVQSAAFFAVPPDRPHAGLVPVADPPLFYALPVTPTAGEKASPAIVPLYARRGPTGAVHYTTDPAPCETAVGRVWRSPSSVLALDEAVAL